VAIAIGLHGFLLTRGSNWLPRKSQLPPVKRAVTLTLIDVKPVEKRVVLPPKASPQPLVRPRTTPRREPKALPRAILRPRPKRQVKKARRTVANVPSVPPKKKHETQKPKPETGAVDTARKAVPIRQEPARYKEPVNDEIVEELLSDLPHPIPETPDPGPPDRGTPSAGPPGASLARPLYRENPRPSYPSVARRRGYEGIVVLEVLVMETGRVGDIRIFHSSGHRRLDRAAEDAVRKWRFEPGTRNGIPLRMTVKVPIRFKLD